MVSANEYCRPKCSELSCSLDAGASQAVENVVGQSWTWSTTCPSIVFQLYGPVFVCTVLLQGVASVASLCCSVLSLPWCARVGCFGRSGSNLSRVDLKAYMRMFNVVELAAVVGLWYPPVAWAAVESLLCHWTCCTLVSEQVLRSARGEALHNADQSWALTNVHGIPRAALLLTVFVATCIGFLVVGGGDLFGAQHDGRIVAKWVYDALWGGLFCCSSAV